MQAAFGALIWSLKFFFDFEVIFPMLFQLGTEKSTVLFHYKWQNSALVLDRHLVQPYGYLKGPHRAGKEPSWRSFEVSMWFYEVSIKYQSWVLSFLVKYYCRFFCTQLKLHVEDDLEIKKNCRDQIRSTNDPCMQKFES